MIKNILVLFLMVFAFHLAFSQTWSPLPGAPTAGRFDDIYFVNDSIGWAVNNKGLVFKANLKKKTWVVQLSTGVYNRSVEFLDDTTGFVGCIDASNSSNPSVFRTSDAGKTWKQINSSFPVPISSVCGMSHRGDTIVMVGAFFGSPFVNRSMDRGKTWTYADMSAYASGLVDTWFKSRDTIFVSGNGPDGRGIILRSADTGKTWKEVSTPGTVPTSWGWKFIFPTASVGYVSLEEVNLNDVYLGNQTHVLKTIDGGRTWNLIDTKVGKNIDIQGIGFIDANHGWIGGNSQGMYETKDGGLSWKLVNNYANLDRFFPVNKNTYFFSGKTIFQLDGLVTGIDPEVNTNIHSLEIYPNPAQDECQVKITLDVATMAVISLRDITGKPLREIYKGHTDAGVHKYEIDIKDLAPGEYIIYLLTNEHFLGKKMIKLK
jgi:photosystem II stability/assembly factor-like uncharacterized protein